MEYRELACEQALLFGRAKRAVRERASERRRREEPARVLFTISPNGELALRLTVNYLCSPSY